ncbi:M23 family metallopeptidase [Streptomyces cinnamoneus]|uniref:M23 family metallopeptidase n=1 Tax=Streptomyces cinnamoneus TaxID=53446 RepID=UPI0015E3E884|nr:M23 family metallopeptidase [Streptomyces cinnamoneus]
MVSPLLVPEPSAAVKTPEKLVRVSSEVLRLARETGRVRQRYEREARAAKEQKKQADRLAQQLRGRRVVSDVLREDAGAVARAQYRTGGFTATGSPALAEDPLELLELQERDMARRERLGRMLLASEGERRALMADSLSTTASWQALDADAARLRTEKRDLEGRLANARGELNGMAQAAVSSGHCVPVDVGDLQDGQSVADRRAEVSADGWTRPLVSYELTAGFGGSGVHWSGGHTGQDFAAPTGSPVRAVGAGTVISTGCGGPFGISVVVRHAGGWYSHYAHLAAPLAVPGHKVRAGEWIGLSGTTGNSTGPHLHFEIRTTPEFGSAVEPVGWLRKRGVRL